MKYLLYLIFALNVFAIQDVSAQESESELQFGVGTNFYLDGEYESALDEWLSVYNRGFSSPELCYNIGNAYFKLDNVPGAILYYERALLLDPTDEDINYNLQTARAMVVDRFEEIPELFFVRWFDLVALMVASNGWAIISLSAFVVCLVFASVYFFTSVYRLKVSSFWLAVVLLIVSFASFSFSIRSRNLITYNESAIIFLPMVSGKSSPDNSGTDLFILHEGTKVDVTDQVGEWFEIRLSDGNKGWVTSGSLQVI